MRRSCVFVLSGILCCIVVIAWTGFFRPSMARADTTTITIEITGIASPPGFLPALLSVHVHDTVVFLNDANPAATYSVAATDQSFASPPIAPGQQWATTFTTPGVYDYTDPAHASQMYGELVVAPASVQLLPTPQPGAVATALAQDQGTPAPTPATTATSLLPPAQRTPLLPLLLGGLGGLVGVIIIVLLVVQFRSRRRHKAATPPARHR